MTGVVMREHAAHEETNEPDDGWQTADPVIDTEVITIWLCRYTGERIDLDQACPHHGPTGERPRHPDEPCITAYVQVEALRRGDVPVDLRDLPRELRLPYRGGDFTGLAPSVSV